MKPIDLLNLDPELVKAITENAYTLEWRQKVALQLLTLHMPIQGIIHSIRGNLDGMNLKIYCREHMLPYSSIRQILG